ncbi:Polyphosphate kinase [Galdieria sulphuraria]|nr:Polyphosphate kinase [Galdieria sulphuraria]
MDTETEKTTEEKQSSLGDLPRRSPHIGQEEQEEHYLKDHKSVEKVGKVNLSTPKESESPVGCDVAEVNTKDFSTIQNIQPQNLIGRTVKSPTIDSQEDIALAREAGVPEASRTVSVVNVQIAVPLNVSMDSSNAEPAEVSSVSSASSAAVTAATIGKDACLRLLDGKEYIVRLHLIRTSLNKKEKNFILTERLKFLCIVSSNLDEYFAKRMFDIKTGDPALYATLSEKIHQLCRIQEECLLEDILPALEECHMHLTRFRDLTRTQQESMCLYYREKVFPLLTPLSLDTTHPFPLLRSHSLYLAVLLQSEEEKKLGRFGQPHFAWLRVPNRVPRFISPNDDPCKFLPIERLILHNLDTVFEGMYIISTHPFRVTRNTSLDLDSIYLDEDEDFLRVVEENILKRQRRAAVRLEVSSDVPDALLTVLKEQLDLDDESVYFVRSPILGLKDAFPLSQLKVFPELRYPKWEFHSHPTLKMMKERNISFFDAMRRSDLLFRFPFHSFDESTLTFLQTAAKDSSVFCIKIVLYRCGDNSPIVAALVEAAQRGVDVSVIIELKASFDEDQNVLYARILQNAGCNVAYGVKGLKTHAKVILVIREENLENGNKKFQSYVNISTGNYNASTARLYTDLSFFTCKADICADVQDLFNVFTGISRKKSYRKLLVSPMFMLDQFLDLIQVEIENARNGKPAQIVAQMNGLTESRITEKLYEASQAGVQIDLIVRGMCRVRPGVKGKSESIRVISILGRFLQHARVFFFMNHGSKPKFFIGSADWRSRNLISRVEVVTPIEDSLLQKKLWKYLRRLRTNEYEGWEMLSDGRYRKALRQDKSHTPKDGVGGDTSQNINMEEESNFISKSLFDRLWLDDTEDDSEHETQSSGGTSREEEWKMKKHKDNREPLQVYKAGCIAVRVNSKGVNQILLITARNRESMLEGGEADAWVLPRGTVLPSETPAEAAIRETLEEAGVGGEIGPLICTTQQRKGRKTIETSWHLLRVDSQASTWDDAVRRRRQWFTFTEAERLLTKAHFREAVQQAKAMFKG